jgi:hypothetical protein
VDTDADNGYALLYTCATDWWLLGVPRHTENAWILARRDSLDQEITDYLKTTLKAKVPDYNHEAVWTSSTT